MKTLLTMALSAAVLGYNPIAAAGFIYGTINNSDGTQSMISGTTSTYSNAVTIYNQDGTSSTLNTYGGGN